MADKRVRTKGRRRQARVIGGDPSARHLPWIVMMMVFIATLAVAGALATGAAIESWRSGLVGGLTVQVPPGPSAKPDEALVDRTVGLLRATPGVAGVTVVPREETARLLRPWLGSSEAVLDLPLPVVIDVRLRDGSRPDLVALDTRLREMNPAIEVDDHQLWLDRLIRYAETAEAIALLAVALILLTAIVTVVFLTLTRLSIHRDVIGMLHVMGASDSYVARQFQRHALVTALGGSVVGFAAAAIALAGLEAAAMEIEQGLIPVLHLGPRHWAALAGVPVAAVLVATVTARVTVLRALARLA